MTHRAELLIPHARAALEGKNFVKARWLARILEVSASLAGQCLRKMPEWEPWNKNARSYKTWYRAGRP